MQPFPKPDPKPYRCKHPRAERVLITGATQGCEQCGARRTLRSPSYTWGPWKAAPHPTGSVKP